METQTITIRHAHLAKLVTNVAPVAATDGRETPSFRWIRLWGDGKTIYAEATNRYAAIRGRLVEIKHEPFDVNLSAKMLRKFVREIKPPRGYDQHVTLTIGDAVTLSRAEGGECQVSLAIQEGAFPALDAVFIGDGSSVEAAGINGCWLALMPKSSQVVASFGADKVLRFYERDGSWVMAIMGLTAARGSSWEQASADARASWTVAPLAATEVGAA